MKQPVGWIDDQLPCYDTPGPPIPDGTPVWPAWQSLGHHWQKKTSIFIRGAKVSATFAWPEGGYRTQFGGIAYAVRYEGDLTYVYRYIAEGLKVWWVEPICQVPVSIAAVRADLPSYLMEALL